MLKVQRDHGGQITVSLSFRIPQAPSRWSGSHPWLRALPPPLILLLVPVLVLTGDRSLIFNFAGYVDPWVYYGLYRNLSATKTLFPATYYPIRGSP